MMRHYVVGLSVFSHTSASTPTHICISIYKLEDACVCIYVKRVCHVEIQHMYVKEGAKGSPEQDIERTKCVVSRAAAERRLSFIMPRAAALSGNVDLHAPQALHDVAL